MEFERIEEIYGALDKMSVALDPDPVSRGPQYMQDLVSVTRGFLNEVGVYIQEAHRERHRLEMSKEALEMVFQAKSDELLVNDKRVSGLPSIEDRRSMINLILKDDRREISEVSGKLRAISLVEKALRFRHKELDSTMSAIRVQRSLISMELGSGSVYGDESETSRGSMWGKKKPLSSSVPGISDEDEEDLEADLAKQMGELLEDPQKEAQSSPASEPPSESISVPVVPLEKDLRPSVELESSNLVKEGDNVSFGEDDFDSFLSMEPPGTSGSKLFTPTSREKTPSKRPVPEEDPDVNSFLEEDEFSDFLDSI